MLLELLKFTVGFVVEAVIEVVAKVLVVPKFSAMVPKLGSVFAGALI